MTSPIRAKGGGGKKLATDTPAEKNARKKEVATSRVQEKGGQKKNSHGAARESRRWI